MIYLDNAATSFPKPESVYRAMDRCAREQLANPGRSGHKMALDAQGILEECRHRLNQFFHGAATERWALTFNCSDGLNMAIKGVLQPGDHVITTDLEHNSVSRPLVALERAGVIGLTRVKHDGTATIDPAAIGSAITPKTKLIAMTHASNAIGTVQPIETIGGIARDNKVLFLVDAAQSAGVIPINLQSLNVDLLAFPGHKSLFGPTGIGALYVAPDVQIRPWREGGTGGDSLSPVQPSEFPHRLEGGTPNVLGAAGLIAGIAFVEERGIDTIRKHELALSDRLRNRLSTTGCEIIGHSDSSRRVGALSFRHSALAASELAGVLDQAFDIAVRAGLHCAPYVHKSFGTIPEGLVRASPGPFNTEKEIDQLADAVQEIVSNM